MAQTVASPPRAKADAWHVWIVNQIALSFAPRVRIVIASTVECDREPSAALRSSLPLPLLRQLFDTRAL